ncbi:MAG: STAS domain-containing protein, partial [Planctomycetota bacterium]|nr:STAS domain-containing protein [Planctomycetota bacterium]
MPAWPGGPCPKCGVDMPENQIRCSDCRTLLNTDLQVKEIAAASFSPLGELQSVAEFAPRSFSLNCPSCDGRIRLPASSRRRDVCCELCQHEFRFELTHVRFTEITGNCPHCRVAQSISPNDLGETVACDKCGGRISLFRLKTATTIEQVGNVTMVAFSLSRQDMGKFDQIGEDLEALIAGTGPLRIALDMSEVEYLHSQALGMLVRFLRRVTQSGGKIATFGILSMISEVLSLAQLGTFFNIHVD